MTDVITTDARKELWFKTSAAPPPAEVGKKTGLEGLSTKHRTIPTVLPRSRLDFSREPCKLKETDHLDDTS